MKTTPRQNLIAADYTFQGGYPTAQAVQKAILDGTWTPPNVAKVN
jgi:hypothetical protein